MVEKLILPISEKYRDKTLNMTLHKYDNGIIIANTTNIQGDNKWHFKSLQA